MTCWHWNGGWWYRSTRWIEGALLVSVLLINIITHNCCVFWLHQIDMWCRFRRNFRSHLMRGLWLSLTARRHSVALGFGIQNLWFGREIVMWTCLNHWLLSFVESFQIIKDDDCQESLYVNQSDDADVHKAESDLLGYIITVPKCLSARHYSNHFSGRKVYALYAPPSYISLGDEWQAFFRDNRIRLRSPSDS